MRQQQSVVENLRSKIREVPGFPRPDILFYDITTVLQDGQAFHEAVDLMVSPFRDTPIDLVVAIESRGFIFAAPMAYILGAGFAPIRKPGKLPAATLSRDYQLEYATNTLEMHVDAVRSGQRVLLVDDLLATGGTAEASLQIVREAGGVPVGLVVLVELESLHGRERLAPYGIDIVSFITY